MFPIVEQIMNKRHAARRRLRMWALFLVIGFMLLVAFLVNQLLHWRWPDVDDLAVPASWIAMFVAPAVPL